MAGGPERDDDSGDTEMFQRFVDRDEPEVQSGTNTFRVVTLVVGLLVFVGLVWLLFRL